MSDYLDGPKSPSLNKQYAKKFIVLVHHPILGKRGEVITTSVTNLDIHDIARTSRTYGFDGYLIVTPVVKQHALVKKILNYWNTDVANDYNPDRSSALSFIELHNSFESAIDEVTKRYETEGLSAHKVITGANFQEFDGPVEVLKNTPDLDKKILFLVFGTGWGLHEDVVKQGDFLLEPIYGRASDGYNHLSVRSAVAIYADRL